MKKLLLASIGLSMLVLWAISCGGGGNGINGTPAPKPADNGYHDDGYLAPAFSRSAM